MVIKYDKIVNDKFEISRNLLHGILKVVWFSPKLTHMGVREEENMSFSFELLL